MIPLLEQLLAGLPAQAATAALAVGLAGAIAGGVLWLAGSRFNRSIVTLLTVSLGAWVGLQLPRWLLLPVGGWATAVGAALILGVSGYILHRLWVGVGLALLNGLWAAFFVLAAYGVGQALSRPAPQPPGTPFDYALGFWALLPADPKRFGSLICLVAIAAGLSTAIIWPRLAMYLFHSLLGVTVLLVLGAVSLAVLRPQLLSLVPAGRTAQMATLSGMVIFGALAQWRMAAKPHPAESARPRKEQGD